MPTEEKRNYASVWIAALMLILVGMAVWAFSRTQETAVSGATVDNGATVDDGTMTSLDGAGSIKENEDGGAEAPSPNTSELAGEVEVKADAGVSLPGVRELTVAASSFSFTPATITVKKGDKVKITLDNKQGIHDLVVDEYNVRTPQLTAGKQATIEFTANALGVFEYYCSVGNHRAMGMVGKLVVE